MYNVCPTLIEFRIALFHALDVPFGIPRFYQGENHILDDKPPLIVMQRPTNLLAFEDYKIRVHFIPSWPLSGLFRLMFCSAYRGTLPGFYSSHISR